jgi:hypothetical protein
MMAVLEAVLALIGLGLLLLLAVSALDDKAPASPPAPPLEDAAQPYREGLHAAVRMQRVAQDLEQQIYAAAANCMETEQDMTRTRDQQ